MPLTNLSHLVFGVVASGVGATGASQTLSATWRAIKADAAAPEAWPATTLATTTLANFVSETNWNPGRLSVGTIHVVVAALYT
jgi:hypothetical protein